MTATTHKSPKMLARFRPAWFIAGMPGYLGRLLFPNDRGSARRRKMRILWLTVVLAVTASALVAGMFYWAYQSGRF